VIDYLSSASLFAWARKDLSMPERKNDVLPARGGHLDVLKWLRARKDDALGLLVCVSILQRKAIFTYLSGCEPGDLVVLGANGLAQQLR